MAIRANKNQKEQDAGNEGTDTKPEDDQDSRQIVIHQFRPLS